MLSCSARGSTHLRQCLMPPLLGWELIHIGFLFPSGSPVIMTGQDVSLELLFTPNNVRIMADRCQIQPQIQPTGLAHENSGLGAHRPSDWTGKLRWGVSVCLANQAGHEFCLSSPISLGQNCLATPSDILVPLACTVPSITHAEPVQCQLVLKATSLGDPPAVKARCLWYLPISGDSELNTEAN